MQMQHTGGELAHHDLIPVSLLQSTNEDSGFYRTVVDEEGLCKHKPMNLKASLLAGHYVVGDVVYCKSEEVK